MNLKNIYNSKNPVISYEIFPPKTINDTESLFQELKQLSEFNPAFISVTYGAGGSTREKTLELVLRIRDELNICPIPHFTCVNTTKTEILAYLKEIQNADIKNILALRGDPPGKEGKFVKIPDGFGYASELIEFIRSNTDLGILAAGYPEGHHECKSLEQDIINLKKKVDAGANVIITQLFYDNAAFLNFLEKINKAGIKVPVIPGILPMTSLAQIQKIASLCSAKIPDNLMQKLINYQDDSEAVKKIGIDYAIEQCRELIENNISGLHFYTLNKSFAVKSVLQELNIK